MARPVGFEGAISLAQGSGDIPDLPCVIVRAESTDHVMYTSCWRFSEEELREIAGTGCVWVTVMATHIFPLRVHGDSPVLYNQRPSRPEPGGVV